jgi:hypothetical protein
MRTRNKVGVTFLIIGGIMMIVSSTLGSIGVYEFIASWITNNIPPDLLWLIPIVDVFLIILRWIADLGGGAVIIGALVMTLGSYRFGKWLVSIGLAFGTLTLIIWILTQVIPISDFITDPVILGYIAQIASLVEANTLFQISGVAVAIIGKSLAKKPKKVKEEEEEEISEETREEDAETPLPFQNIFCPECGTSIPFNAEFCSECGHTIERT